MRTVRTPSTDASTTSSVTAEATTREAKTKTSGVTSCKYGCGFDKATYGARGNRERWLILRSLTMPVLAAEPNTITCPRTTRTTISLSHGVTGRLNAQADRFYSGS